MSDRKKICHFIPTVRQEEDLSLHSYYLEKGKAAVVYAATARFICSDFQCRPRDDREVIELSVCEQLHLDIFQSPIVIYNRAIMTPSTSYLSKQEKKDWENTVCRTIHTSG